MRKKLAGAMLALFMVCTGAVSFGNTLVTVSAASYTAESGVADFEKGDGSITIQGNAGQSLAGKVFTVYKLFHAENSVGGESVNYTFNEDYKAALQNVVGAALSKNPADVTEYEVIDYIRSLNNHVTENVQADQILEGRYSDFRYFIENLRDEMVALDCKGDTVIVSTASRSNSIKIEGLEYGYYIIDEVSNNSGEHSASSLCMVNTANPDASIYIKSDYPDVGKKIQEDDDKDEVGSNGWNDIADYEIGQNVPYKFESNIPNINGYETYYYAWHDVMDEALTFNKDSVKIIISDGKKEYIMTSPEFSVIENPDEDTTFKVEIADIKAIIDREFNNIDELGHNTYGQTVTLTYEAILNDKAADDTGRPGFENDVRLEFSNDADVDGIGKTGFTPWDTVVCFTYKIDVRKTNDQDQPLENAKFRLYSDASCENEVYVKKTENGYNVINRDSVGGTDHIGGTVPADAVEMVSDENGNFIIFGLDDGTYYLKETDAPEGYRVIFDPVKLTVDATYTTDRNSYVKGDGATDKTLMTLDISAYVKQFLSGTYKESTDELITDVETGSGNLTVINHVGSKLPVTGSVGTIALIGIGSAAMLAGLGIFRKKKD